MELIDNVNKTLKDDLTVSIQKDSKVSIAAACFSIYAFQELKRELKNVDELRFIFTSPTFIKEKAKKEKREFYIPRQTRERSLYGSEFEVKLRNEMTQRAIAKECAEWIRKKTTFKSNVTSENMMGFMNVDSNSYMPINGFTTIDLGCERGNNAYYPIQKTDTPMSQFYLNLFEQIWNDEARLQEVTDEVIDSITTVYNENSPDYIYFVTLYNIFNEFLEDVSEDVLPNEATGFKESKIWNLLYNFQKDAVLAIINKLEKYNGCILADSVGLGKTFTSLAVIKYYENRNKSVLVLCPKKLANNWNTYKDNYVNNPIAADRMRYDVLFHTDLSRDEGTSNGLDLDRLNWGNYDLVVIDESHNFRNGGRVSQDGDKENRYLKLLNRVIRKGVKTKVLMLSATPVNNRFVDLKNQIALAYEGESSVLDGKLNTSRSIEDIFKQAQGAFNTWSKWEPQDRTTSRLLAPSPIECSMTSYIYDENGFLEEIGGNDYRKIAEEKYKIEEEYIWYFRNDEELKEFWNATGVAAYYNVENIPASITAYTVRALNYQHTGVGINAYNTDNVYIAADGSKYVCLKTSRYLMDKWVPTEELEKFRPQGTTELFKYEIPDGTVLETITTLEIETDIVNIVGKADIPAYKIEENKVIFE